MPLYIASLNSGSNGNCYYIGNDEEAILVDAGISCREVEKRMKRLSLSMDRVKAIFISHEHSDHIRGLHSMIKRHSVPVYITDQMLAKGGMFIDRHRTRPYLRYEPVMIGSLSIRAFPKYHDACDPHSFIVSDHETVIGVFTDIGRPCEELKRHFSQCHAVFLESNYDEEMLDKGSYPYHLKRRIRGGNGHLSNREALKIFTDHRAPFLSHLVLAHLSQNNNDPDLVDKLFRPHARNIELHIASRHNESPVFRVAADPKKSAISYSLRPTVSQLQLFAD